MHQARGRAYEENPTAAEYDEDVTDKCSTESVSCEEVSNVRQQETAPDQRVYKKVSTIGVYEEVVTDMESHKSVDHKEVSDAR